MMTHVPSSPDMWLMESGKRTSFFESRLASIAFAIVVVAIGFATVIVGLRLTRPMMLGAFVIILFAVGITSSLLIRRYPRINEMLAGERMVLTLSICLCAVVYPLLAENPYQIHVMAMGGIFAIMALGLNINIGYAGLADFGYIAYYAIGAYASALLNMRLGLSVWLCIPLAGVVAAALSLAVSFPALRVKGHYLALVTLGFAFIVMQLITNLQALTGGTQGISGIVEPQLFRHSFRAALNFGFVKLPYQANFYYLVLVVLVLAALVCSRLSASRWGRAWAAMKSDEVAAEASGLSLTKLKLLAFGTAAAFGGIAGALYAHIIGFLDPSSFKFIESIFVLAVVVLGSFRIPGIIVAAIVFTVLPEKLRAFDDWRLLIFGTALLVVMLVRGRRMLSGGR